MPIDAPPGDAGVTPERLRELQRLAFGAGIDPTVAQEATRQLRDAAAGESVARAPSHGAGDDEAGANDEAGTDDEAGADDEAAEAAETGAGRGREGDSGAVVSITAGSAGDFGPVGLNRQRRLFGRIRPTPWVVGAIVVLAGAGVGAGYLLTGAVAGATGDPSATSSSSTTSATSATSASSVSPPAATAPDSRAVPRSVGSTGGGGDLTAAQTWFERPQESPDFMDVLLPNLEVASTRFAGGGGTITSVWVARSKAGEMCLAAEISVAQGDPGPTFVQRCAASDDFSESGLTLTNDGDVATWDGRRVTISAVAPRG